MHIRCHSAFCRVHCFYCCKWFVLDSVKLTLRSLLISPNSNLNDIWRPTINAAILRTFVVQINVHLSACLAICVCIFYFVSLWNYRINDNELINLMVVTSERIATTRNQIEKEEEEDKMKTWALNTPLIVLVVLFRLRRDDITQIHSILLILNGDKPNGEMKW